MSNPIPYTLNVNGRLIELSEPLVMGILNATPDSFYADSRKQSEHDIAQRAEQIVQEGGRIIDVGSYSTRPGATDVSEEEETSRLVHALSVIRRIVPDAIVSVDTFRARVAERMVGEFGVAIVNDVSGGEDAEMFSTVARLGVAYVLTNKYATALPVPLAESVVRLRELGQKDIILDPGFGFGKTLDDNYRLLMQLEVLHAFDLPLLVGVSRKSMIWKLLGSSPEDALNGTTVLHTLALERGANILRVHDVAKAIEVTKIMKKCSSLSA